MRASSQPTRSTSHNTQGPGNHTDFEVTLVVREREQIANGGVSAATRADPFLRIAVVEHRMAFGAVAPLDLILRGGRRVVRQSKVVADRDMAAGPTRADPFLLIADLHDPVAEITT